MFKVVTDQLKVSQGWVRCGYCTEVFDASLYIQNTRSPVTAKPNTPNFKSPGVQTEVLATLEETLAPKPFSTGLSASTLSPNADADADAGAESLAAGLQASLPDDNVSFVRDARKLAFWRKPAVRFVLGLSGFLLLILLILQFSVQQRDNLAAVEPRLKPWLNMMCEPLQCKISPLRRIETVVIESSSFNKVSDDTYRLSFAIKNTGSTSVEMPSLDVILADTREQALMRRVVTPNQFSAENSTGLLAAGSEFSGAIVIRVLGSRTVDSLESAALNTDPLHIAGYRIVAFYP